MKEKSTRKEIFYDKNIGWAEIYKIPDYPDRLWIRAGGWQDLTDKDVYQKTIEVIYDIFVYLKECGFSEVYCHVDNQKSFNFNMRTGFEPTFEIIPDKGIEFMKRVL